MHLNLTTTAGCRGRCVYCPQDRYQAAMAGRPRHLTASELADLIPALEDTHFDAWSFGGFSEPFDNPEIVELLRLTAAQPFVDDIVIYTNGETLTPAIARALSDVPLAAVDVSCHGFDPDVYRRTRSFIDPHAVRENVLYLLAHRDNVASLTISVTGPFGAQEDLEELEALCAAAGASLFRRRLHSRAGLLRIGKVAPLAGGPFRCAKYDFEKPVLVPGGDVSLCCQDFALDYVIGNLHRQSFGEIMRDSPLRRHILDVAAGRSDDPALRCYQCAFCEPVEPRVA